jgi:hypothetical protein
MAVMPGIFLDHVDIDPAQIDRHAPLRMHERVVERAPRRHRPRQPASSIVRSSATRGTAGRVTSGAVQSIRGLLA